MKKQITLSNLQIIEILRGVNSITESDTKYPVSFLWKVNGNIKRLSEIQQRIAEEEQKIDSEFSTEEKATQNENGWQIKEEYRQDFITAKQELFAIENEIDIDVIAVSEIADLEFTMPQYNTIAFMLDDSDT